MSDKYSKDFKAKVALDAVSQSRAIIGEIAEKYDVSEEEVLAWIARRHEDIAPMFSDDDTAHIIESEVEDVSLETEDEAFAHAVEHGVMDDDLNYSRLIFWSAFGTALVAIFVVGLVYFSQYSLFETQKEVSKNSTYSEVKELRAGQKEQLNSFGVVDLENGVYHIPIDSAINNIAVD